MSTKSTGGKRSAEHVVKDIRRATRRHFSSEDKIRIVLDGLRGEDSLADLDRKLFFIRDYRAMSFSQFDLEKLAALKAPISQFEQDAVEATDRLMAIATRAPAS